MNKCTTLLALLVALQGCCQLLTADGETLATDLEDVQVATDGLSAASEEQKNIRGPVAVLLDESPANNEELQVDNTHQDTQQTTTTSEPAKGRAQLQHKCVPMLKFARPGGNMGQPLAQSAEQLAPVQSLATHQTLAFPVGDIDLPVALSGGSIDSAMRLLSTFGGQLDPQGDNGQEVEPVDNVAKFRDNRLHIQGLNLSMLNVHLYSDGDPKFGIGINIKNTTMTGRFSYKGPAIFTDSPLVGYYRMSIDNIYLVASSNLTKRQRQQSSEPSAFGTSVEPLEEAATAEVERRASGAETHHQGARRFYLTTNEFKMNITNLGYITIEILDSPDSNKPTSNYLLRMLQRLLQRTIKRTYYTFESYIREALEQEARRALDCELTRFTPLLDESGASSHRGDLARIMSNEIERSQLSTVQLPDFEHQQSILGSNALVRFYNGSLSGLDRVKLSGESRIKLQDEHLFVNTSIGWSDLRPYYNWSLIVGGSKEPMSKGFVLFNIKGVDFDAVITKGLEAHTRIVVEQLAIKRLDSPKMDIGGLPGMNRVTRGIVNFFMGRLKQRLASSIQPTLKQQLERALNRITILA